MKNAKPFFIIIIIILLSACRFENINNNVNTNDKINIVATTSIVFDIVSNISGDAINLENLLPVGTDPHSFSPTPQDLAKLSDADLIFANGADLELFLEDMLENTNSMDKVIYLSNSHPIIMINEIDSHNEQENEEHKLGNIDPHTWTNPINVIAWTNVIKEQLTILDPKNAVFYEENLINYQKELQKLDEWIQNEVEYIPLEKRKLITDHMVFGYFSDRYGFEQIGSVYSSASTLAEPSAQELAALENLINREGVSSIFVGNTVSATLSKRIGMDTGATIYFVYTGSLSNPDEEASSYINYMKYNVNTIVNALKE